MSNLLQVDLEHDPLATRWQKRVVPVQVEFAVSAGTLMTLEGPVDFAARDALVTGAAGDRWPVTRATFDARYRAANGTPGGATGTYLKLPMPVLARKVGEAFAIRLPDGQILHGHAGDWLVQYGVGDQAIVADTIFGATYDAS